MIKHHQRIAKLLEHNHQNIDSIEIKTEELTKYNYFAFRGIQIPGPGISYPGGDIIENK